MMIMTVMLVACQGGDRRAGGGVGQAGRADRGQHAREGQLTSAAVASCQSRGKYGNVTAWIYVQRRDMRRASQFAVYMDVHDRRVWYTFVNGLWRCGRWQGLLREALNAVTILCTDWVWYRLWMGGDSGIVGRGCCVRRCMP
jgi:hypothetical protein